MANKLIVIILTILLLLPKVAMGEIELPLPEKITYAIKKVGMRAGTAVLTFKGPVIYEQQELFLITFEASGLNFYDQENIYADPQTFYPVVVERDINIFGKKEKITEDYSQEGVVSIVKKVKNKVEEQLIQKSGHIDNIYCFIYRQRREGMFKVGDAIKITLPTQNLVMNVDKLTKLKSGGKLWDAYYLKSNPEKYQVWFDASDQKIPLRINGAVGFGDTAMTMVEYEVLK